MQTTNQNETDRARAGACPESSGSSSPAAPAGKEMAMLAQNRLRIMDRIKLLESDPAFDAVKGILAQAAVDVNASRFAHAGFLMALASRDCPAEMPTWQRHQLLGVVYELDTEI